jgi:hypothetical protein
MRVQDLIKELSKLPRTAKIQIACDEEFNIIFNKMDIDENEDNKYVIYGLSGSEDNI